VNCAQRRADRQGGGRRAEWKRTKASKIDQEAVHLEMRDAYGTAVELPHIAKWAAGEPDDLEWLKSWCATLHRHAAAGRSVRRARIVSEPRV